jgi:3-dehydroquinate synthase
MEGIMKSVITVELPQQTYDIVIAAAGLAQLGNWLQPLKLGKKVLLVSNPIVFNPGGGWI